MKMSHKTSDFLEAATLLLLKYPLLDVDATNPRRTVFEFEGSGQLQEDIIRLKQGRLLVDPADFWAAERRCKQLIYGGQSGLAYPKLQKGGNG